MPIYAREGILEVWLVDLAEQTLSVFRNPSGDGYLTSQIFRRGETASPAEFPQAVLNLDDILGPVA